MAVAKLAVEKSKNVYQKLQSVRVKLQQKDLKMSGDNAHLKAKYFILKDFIPDVNALFNSEGLCSVIKFTTEVASLTVINSEIPDETIEFVMPMSSSNLKNVHEVQNLGSTITYQRKYLYLIALEIVEHDILDAETGRVDPDAAYNDFEKNWLDQVHDIATHKGITGVTSAFAEMPAGEHKSKFHKKHSKFLRDIAEKSDKERVIV